ncbi:hypothetical protein SAY86_021496 [Trapa natans]|uniref:stearoyl-[acyl-carrier-protein] 9-desaturase n=1 Tax=Trapa natans TaxID=22666 RepID=A0AAN7M8T4_TRANT|nr:hypothetical protein SAY86_021496 [Trapa natans]
MINTLDGVRDETGASLNPWVTWTRQWTAEENRHEDREETGRGGPERGHRRRRRPTAIRTLLGSGISVGSVQDGRLRGHTGVPDRAVAAGEARRACQGKQGCARVCLRTRPEDPVTSGAGVAGTARNRSRTTVQTSNSTPQASEVNHVVVDDHYFLIFLHSSFFLLCAASIWLRAERRPPAAAHQ